MFAPFATRTAQMPDVTNKACTVCKPGSFLHPGSATCLDLCPSYYAENTGIDFYKVSDDMFNLHVSNG
jgi:hypothetical protein